MARSTCNIFNPQVRGARANGYAIVTGADFGVKDCDVRRELDVNSVGVRAVSGGDDLDTSHFDVVASIENYVEQLAIKGCQSTYRNIFGVAK